MTQSLHPVDAPFGAVCVVGLGYIGLPTAAFIASKGLQVVGVDINRDYVERINRGEVPFFEPEFESTLAGVVEPPPSFGPDVL